MNKYITPGHEDEVSEYRIKILDQVNPTDPCLVLPDIFETFNFKLLDI